MKIFKSQIGNATHVAWSPLTIEFDYCVHGPCKVIFSRLYSESQAKKVKHVTFQFHKCQPNMYPSDSFWVQQDAGAIYFYGT